jgi:sugar-specific transcriptional regulator TrmB
MNNVESEEVVAFLDELSLTKYEKLGYLTVLLHGAQNYKTMVRISGIPYGRIYSVMTHLEEKGLVSTSNDRPKIFRAVDPQLVFEEHCDRMRRAIHDFAATGERVLPVLRPVFQRATRLNRRSADFVRCRHLISQRG